MNHDILRGRIEEACDNIAEYGIEGVSDKEVTLACFGLLMFNGIDSLKKVITKSVIAICTLLAGALIAILLAVLL